jgi:hypothetical protein
MDMNDWVLGTLIHQRLDDIRTQTRRMRLAATLRPRRQPLRTVLGLALTHIGRATGRPTPDAAESVRAATSRARGGSARAGWSARGGVEDPLYVRSKELA